MSPTKIGLGDRAIACKKKPKKPTFAATPSFLAGAFFLVMPEGFTLLIFATRPSFLVAVLLVLGFVVRLMVGAVSIAWKMRGLELPVAERVPSRAMVSERGWNYEKSACADG